VPSIGEASVDVVADGRRFRRDVEREVRAASGQTVNVGLRVDAQGNIRDELGRFARQAEQEGGRAGGRFSRAFNSQLDLKVARAALAGLALPARGLGFAAVGASAAVATASIVKFAAALAPAVGALAALPSAAGVAAAGVATLRVALAGVGDAFGAALGDDAAKFQESLEGLAPEAAAAATALRSLKPEFDALRESVQGAFFEGLDESLTQVAGTLLGPLTQGMTGAASAMNTFIQMIAQVASSGVAVDFIAGSFGNLQAIISNLSAPLASLFQALLEVGVAINTAFGGEQLGSGLADLISQFAEFLSAAAASGDAVSWVEGAITVFQQLGAIISPIIDIFGAIGSAANASGESILGVIGQLVQGVAYFLTSAEGMDFLGELFGVLASLGEALTPIIAAIGTALAGIAPSIAELLTALGPGVETLVGALGEGLASLAPALVPLGEAIVSIVDALAPLLPVIGELLGALVEGAAGILSAFAPLIEVLTTLISSILEPLIPFIEQWAGIMADVLEPAIAAVAAILEQLAPFLTELITMLTDALIPIFERWATEVMPELLPVIMELIQALIDGLMPVIEALLPVIIQIVEEFGGAFLDAIVALLPLLLEIIQYFTWQIETVSPLIAIIAELVGWLAGHLVSAISTVIGWIIDLVGWFADLLSGVFDFVANAGEYISGWVSDIGGFFSDIGDLIDELVGWFAELPGRILDYISGIGQDIKDAIVGPIEDLEDFLGLANGGIVGQDGLYRLAEGNRKEVVIPLTRPRRAAQLADQSGLTGILNKRGKGPGGGSGEITVNVHTNTISPEIVQEKVERALAKVLG